MTTNRDTDYHNARLEQEVTQLRQENANWKQMNVVLDAPCSSKLIRRDSSATSGTTNRLRQAIAVLNDEPTNSL